MLGKEQQAQVLQAPAACVMQRPGETVLGRGGKATFGAKGSSDSVLAARRRHGVFSAQEKQRAFKRPPCCWAEEQPWKRLAQRRTQRWLRAGSRGQVRAGEVLGTLLLRGLLEEGGPGRWWWSVLAIG